MGGRGKEEREGVGDETAQMHSTQYAVTTTATATGTATSTGYSHNHSHRDRSHNTSYENAAAFLGSSTELSSSICYGSRAHPVAMSIASTS